jgi:ribosomal protein L40E
MKIRLCPECGKHNPGDAWNCANCGQALALETIVEMDETLVELDGEESGGTSAPGDGEVPAHREESAVIQTQICPGCGAVNPHSRWFCNECGKSLRHPVPKEKRKAPFDGEYDESNVPVHAMFLGGFLYWLLRLLFYRPASAVRVSVARTIGANLGYLLILGLGYMLALKSPKRKTLIAALGLAAILLATLIKPYVGYIVLIVMVVVSQV